MLNGLPWKLTEIDLTVLRLHPSAVFWNLVEHESDFFSNGFLLTVVDLMVN